MRSAHDRCFCDDFVAKTTIFLHRQNKKFFASYRVKRLWRTFLLRSEFFRPCRRHTVVKYLWLTFCFAQIFNYAVVARLSSFCDTLFDYIHRAVLSNSTANCLNYNSVINRNNIKSSRQNNSRTTTLNSYTTISKQATFHPKIIHITTNTELPIQNTAANKPTTTPPKNLQSSSSRLRYLLKFIS